MLAYKDRLGFLAADVGSYIGELFSMDGVSEQPVTVKIAELAARLPGFHGDRADRIIVATAVERSATLVTRDARINAYAKATTFVNALRC
jgi:PIN domain nuclease of toxin-antitoxin system